MTAERLQDDDASSVHHVSRLDGVGRLCEIGRLGGMSTITMTSRTKKRRVMPQAPTTSAADPSP